MGRRGLQDDKPRSAGYRHLKPHTQGPNLKAPADAFAGILELNLSLVALQ